MGVTKTFYSYFRGGNGVGVGAEKADYVDVGGVEFDKDIAAVCDMNFSAKTTIADVCAVEPGLLLNEAPTWFHASPSCKNASQAKTAEVDEEGNTVRETEADREAGRAVARFISYWKPPMVTIENVWQYRTFEAFEAIREALRDAGYSYEYWHLNSADYGVPQTRKRLILVARLGLHRIQRPNPTHRRGGDMFLSAWRGWFKSVEDLIPTLPESQFAPWQLDRLGVLAPNGITQNALMPCRSVEANLCYPDDPSYTVLADPGQVTRAFVISGGNSSSAEPRYEQEPYITVVSSPKENQYARAFLVDQLNSSHTTIRDADEPTFTLTNYSTKHPAPRAWLSQGRVVKMSARALARFQSLPDSYKLPEKKARHLECATYYTPQQQRWIEEQERCATGLACTVIGNMVCPELAYAIAESQE